MEASTQDKIADLSPAITPAVRVKADRLAKPQELHAHTNPINALPASQLSSATPDSLYFADSAQYRATIEKIRAQQRLKSQELSPLPISSTPHLIPKSPVIPFLTLSQPS
jgi:hypothetical protein